MSLPPGEEGHTAAFLAAVQDPALGPLISRLVSLAARELGSPLAGLSIVQQDRELFTACLGRDLVETTGRVSFGVHAGPDGNQLLVLDARDDPRFAAHPLVSGPPGVRFYAGTPVTTPQGEGSGRLYAMDVVPREQPSAGQLRAVADMAQAVSEAVALQIRFRASLENQELGLHLAAIIGSSDDAITSTNLDGIISSWNKGAERLYGYSPAEILGRHFSVLIPEERPQEASHILRRIRAGEPVRHLETVRVAKDGTPVPVSLTISPIREAEGQVTGTSSIARDMSERRAADKLKAAHDRATAANRLKSQFLATMSHEIRTPMNGVIGMTGLLLDSDLDPEQREYAETVRSSGEALLAIINDILDFSKIEAGKLSLEIIDFNLCAVIEDVADLLAEKAQRKGLELSTFVLPGVPAEVRGDPGRLRQIITNLVSNGVKFTETGHIVVRASLDEDRSDSVVIRVEVADTGIGLTAEAQERLFVPFSQADASTTRSHGGTGLGLAISKQLVEMMGGEISLESRPGSGTTVSFTARLAKQAKSAPVPRDQPADLTGLRVLIVDDNTTNRKILEQQVRSWSMSAASAEGGLQAFEMMRQAASGGEAYQVALVDMEMPGMDGLELCRAVNGDASLSGTRLVLLTSRGAQGTAASLRAADFSAYLTKPVHQSQLYDCLATVVDAATGPARPPVSRHTISEDPARDRPRLLVADDNIVNQSVAVAMLAKVGYRADVVANGAEAVEALSRISYGAVLMDCQMPEMDGYAATAEIRQGETAGRRVPIIAMTASAMKGDRQRCLDAGMDDYLTKPVKLDLLAAAVERWVGVYEDSVGGTG